MKTYKRVLGSVFIVSSLFIFSRTHSLRAATTPSLGEAATYGVLANTYTDTSAATTITGDVGFTTPPATAPAGVHPHYGSGAPYATAGVDQGSALSALAAQPCTFSFADGAVDLSTDTTHGTIGIYAPGVYCSVGAMNVGGLLSLSGSGTYIFRAVGALTSTAGSVVSVASGASACNVFWTPTAATTLAATTTFLGTVIDGSAITVGANTTWLGRALAFNGTVTTDTDTITVPTCASAPAAASSDYNTITVIKNVINDNGGTATFTDFPLYIDNTRVNSGQSVALASGTYTVTETNLPTYIAEFSGDCDANGNVDHAIGGNKICIITNNDVGTPSVIPPVPPIIEIIKLPTPTALPDGPGEVVYFFTVRNLGTVAMTDVTVVDDSCSPVQFTGGDLNSDNTLDVSETWTYQCETLLDATHTNIVIATGWANGMSATDIASATVIVGVPIVPPLIHVTKIPSPLTLPAGGGNVTYTETITNPGTVALSDVSLNDDKCSPMIYVSGDSNDDTLLDTTESWVYTCQSHLTQTTTNTAVAEGIANAITARDFAIVTVVVAAAATINVVPSFPNTGAIPTSLLFLAAAAGVCAVALFLLLTLRLHHRRR